MGIPAETSAPSWRLGERRALHAPRGVVPVRAREHSPTVRCMASAELPGVRRERPSRFRPRLHYELLVCGLAGHELVGVDAETLRPEDAVVAREIDGVRWHRCLRCDSWLPVAAPKTPAKDHPPERDEIQLPLRGRPLRDKIVLRVIAIDRALHFVILALLAGAIFVLAAKRSELRAVFYRLLSDIEGTVVDQSHPAGHGLVHDAEQ